MVKPDDTGISCGEGSEIRRGVITDLQLTEMVAQIRSLRC